MTAGTASGTKILLRWSMTASGTARSSSVVIFPSLPACLTGRHGRALAGSARLCASVGAGSPASSLRGLAALPDLVGARPHGHRAVLIGVDEQGGLALGDGHPAEDRAGGATGGSPQHLRIEPVVQPVRVAGCLAKHDLDARLRHHPETLLLHAWAHRGRGDQQVTLPLAARE